MNLVHAFMPHGTCYLWNPQLLVLQVASDAGIALAYFSIPLTLLYFIRKRRDVPFGGIFVMFGAFIVACGLTHLMGIWTVWHPAYWLDGSIKAATAAVSLATAGMLVPLVPKALALKSPAELERMNARLTEDLNARERALDESRRQYSASAEALPQLVWTANEQGALEYYNQRYFDYTGLTMEQAQGWKWQSTVHPDDIARCLALWRYSVANAVEFELECRLKRASDGTYRWHLCRGTPIRNLDGRIVKWFGTSTDIDDIKRASESSRRFADQLALLNLQLEKDLRARRQAEAALRASDERLRQVEENAPIGLALTALDGGYIRVNPALCALLGFEQAELLSKTSQELTHPGDRAEDVENVRLMLQGALTRSVREKRYFRADGQPVWCLVSRSLVHAETGEPLYFIEQIQDVSERKVAQQEIEAARQTALSASEAKSRFLATMSHEIRTPMNGVIGMTELLLTTSLSAEQSEYVRIARDSGLSLLRVLNDILDYSKIEAGKLDLERTDFELASQIRSVVALLEPQFKSKGVALTTHVDRRVPATLRGDPGRLRQILMNLVSNALKFTPAAGSVWILASLQSQGEEGSSVRFTVRDTGIGIPSDVTAKLFQPFSQASESTTSRFGGTGLGLSICKHLVGLMGGAIGVDSAAHCGSSFWFTVPFGSAAPAEPVLEAPRRETLDRDARVGARPEKLLLAEDNEINALLALRQFKQLGFDVTIVPNGREAVEALERERIDLVFMDVHMPEMDGIEATRLIRSRARARRVPIVALTANALVEDREACLAAGMDDYLAKPVTLEELASAIDRWLLPTPQPAPRASDA